MSNKNDESPENNLPRKGSGFSRRGFLGGIGLGGGALSAGLLEPPPALADPVSTPVSGPAEVPVTLQINGKACQLKIEPRVTLLDALRHRLDLTAAKRVCDRGTCGACTVMIGGKAVYSCTTLAIDAQGKAIQTLEGLSSGPAPHPVSTAFVNNDAQQCGYCTPGFVVASIAFLKDNPSPTYDQVKDGLGGNLCRCGTYVGIRKAVLEAAAAMKGAKHV